MRICDLGALTIAGDAVELEVKGIRAAAILALLTIHVNRRVSTEALMDAVWGERVTSGAASTLESHVWRLRQWLEPERPRRAPPTILINDAGGYRLIGTAHTIDSLAFEHIAEDVRGLLAAGQAMTALTRADDALALWRGRPYGRFADEDFARAAVARLEEVHRQLVERRVDAMLGVGDFDGVLADLTSLIASDPFRERLWEQRILALYRAGRVEQSLRAFQEVRSMLTNEIGHEPGVELQDLHRRILTQDPGLLPRRRAHAASRHQVDVHLPLSLSPLIGRDSDLARLSGWVATNRLVSVVGTAGCGKTRLAVEVARNTAATFPDGVWLVDLTAVSEPTLVVDLVISTIGFTSSPAGSPIEELREYVSDRRMLLVLDNCEHVLPAVAHIVETALTGDSATPDAHACAFLITSREPLNVAGEMVWTLGPLSVLPDADADAEAVAPAVEMFLQRLRLAAPRLTIDADVLKHAVAISTAVDGLPLALELAAARAGTYTLEDVVAQVTADPTALRRIGRGPSDHRETLRSAIDWSYRMLSPAEQLTHRLLAVLPGQFSVATAEAIIDDSAERVTDLLAQLVHRSMLVSEGSGRSGGPTTFRQLATVRAHAQHALTYAGEHTAATLRRDRWTAAMLSQRPRLGTGAEAQWFRGIDDSNATVRETLANHLIAQQDSAAACLPAQLFFYWYYRGSMVEAGRWFRLAHDAVASHDSTDASVSALALAGGMALQGRSELAWPYVEDALGRIHATPPHRRIEVGEALVEATSAAWSAIDFSLLRPLCAGLASIVELTADEHLGVLADALGAIAQLGGGDLGAAAYSARHVYERAVAMNNSLAAWLAAGPPMAEALMASKPAEGIAWVNRIIEGHLLVDSKAGGMFIETRADFAAQSGDFPTAATLFAAAQARTRRTAMRWPRWPVTHDLIAATRDHLSPADYQRASREGEQLTLKDIVEIE